MQRQYEPQSLKDFHQKKAQKIIRKCIWQHAIFKEQDKNKNWRAIHEAHYDWWAFPIDQRSSYGQEYMVSEAEISIMEKSENFLIVLAENAIIVCKAWGWDLINGERIVTDQMDQRWQNWPIRLYKMSRSLQLFGLKKLFKNAVKYGIEIMKSGKHLHYGKRDISAYLSQKWAQIKSKPISSQISSQKPSQYKRQKNQTRSQSLKPKPKGRSEIGQTQLRQQTKPKNIILQKEPKKTTLNFCKWSCL